MESERTRRHFLQSTSVAAAAGMLGLPARSSARTPLSGVDYYSPGQAGYETARRPFNSDIRLKPKLIAACDGDRDVMEAVRRARSESCRCR